MLLLLLLLSCLLNIKNQCSTLHFLMCVCVIDGWPALNHPGGGSNALQFNCVLLLLLRLPMNFVFGVFLSPNFVANHGQKKHDRGKQ